MSESDNFDNSNDTPLVLKIKKKSLALGYLLINSLPDKFDQLKVLI